MGDVLVHAQVRECLCWPCETPAYGVPGFAHCVACCYGSSIAEYNAMCYDAEHREMALKQFDYEDWPL